MPDFSSRTPSRGLQRLQMGQQANAELQKDAFSLAPDTDAITKAIGDRNLSAADLVPLHEEISNEITPYMEKFKKDPFYAFTREGRATTARIKSLINHPDIKKWEENYKEAGKEHERAVSERINKNLVVDGDSVLAIKNNRREYIPISELKDLDARNGDRVLNVDSDMHALKNVYGFRGGVPSYNMTSLEKVDKKISDTLDKAHLGETENAGETGGDGNGVTGTYKRKTNESQLATAVRTLMKSGLSDADRNTLKSEYIKANRENSSNQGFNQWLSDKLSGIATGQISSVRDDGTKKTVGYKADAATAAAENGNKNVKEIGPANQILSGKFGQREENAFDANGYVSHSVVNQLPKDVLNLSNGLQKDKEGNVIPNRTLKDLKLFTSGAVDLNSAMIQDRNSGDPLRVPGLENSVASDKAPPALVAKYTYKVNGKPTIVPDRDASKLMDYLSGDKVGQKIPVNLRQYLDSNGRLQSKQWVSMYVLSNAPQGLMGENGTTRDALDAAGYQKTNDDEANQYFDKYSGTGHDSYSGWNDKKHEVHIYAPLNSEEALRNVFGDKTYGTEDQVDIETGGLQDTYKQFSPAQYDNSIPNQTNPRNFATLSQTQ